MTAQHFQAGPKILADRRAFLSVIPDAIPRELVDDRAWYPALVTPKPGKPGTWDKAPGNPATGKTATWSDPATRLTFGDAYMAYQSDPRFTGIGYMLHATGIVGIDLDDCFAEDGTIKPWAQQIIDGLPGAYWERSISGTGLRGFCRASLPPTGRKCKVQGSSVEIYADVRFLVVTGHALVPVDALPELQAEITTLHGRLFDGRGAAAIGSAIVTGMTGPAADVSPEALAILGDVMGGRWGAQMGEIWGRADIEARDVNEQDWALEKEVTYWAIRRGHSGDDLARIVEQLMRAGPYRRKWDERRGQATWLAQDVANAIATVKKRLGTPPSAPIAPDDGDAAPAPTEETPEQTIARLTRELGQAKATIAVQATIIRSQRAKIETYNRRTYAEWRLRRSKMKSTQVDATVGLANLASKRAEYHQTDSPIITGQQLGDEMGMHESSARSNAEAVCSLPGSPIKRVTDYRKDGKRGKITTYELAVRDPVEILERMVIVAEALEEPKATRPRPIHCPKHPRARVNVFAQHECSRCGAVLASDFPNAKPLCVEVTRIEDGPPSVDVPVVTPVQHARIAGTPDSDELRARRGREAVGIAIRAPDTWKQPEISEPAPNGHAAPEEPPVHGVITSAWGSPAPLPRESPPTRCRLCPSLELYQLADGRWRCDGCGEVAS